MADESGFEVIPSQASSQIDQVQFNAETSQGRIVFLKNGSVYEYDNATREEANQIASGAIGGSVGVTFGQLWKGVKPFRRIS
jgi:N-methylhydantoinase A/oxoprolinase/acetone carboxylase beta subunit